MTAFDQAFALLKMGYRSVRDAPFQIYCPKCQFRARTQAKRAPSRCPRCGNTELRWVDASDMPMQGGWNRKWHPNAPWHLHDDPLAEEGDDL